MGVGWICGRGHVPVIELGVHSILYSLLSRHRVVLLKESQGERYLPIWIGMYESEAIAMRLQGASVPRPLTHDLLANIITEMGGTVQYIVVSDLNDSTFFARIAVRVTDGARGSEDKLQMIDSRPSDAIALAVRVSVPIYAEEAVLDKAGIGVSPEVRTNVKPSEGNLDAFRDFVDGLDLDGLEE